MSPTDESAPLQDLHDRVWLDVHIEGMLAYEEAFEDRLITPGQFINAIQAHLKKLRRAYPTLDD